MDRKILILIFIILRLTRSNATFNHFRDKLEKADRTVKKVRTVDELRKRGNELAVLDFIGLVQQHQGYTAEEYDVHTEDGYILKLHRLSGSPNSPKASGKPVIFMQHFLLGSSDSFVTLGPKQSLAFILADAGYDIWVGNVRGSTYSRRHVKYSTAGSSFDFWNFSLDEMGAIDVPKFIDTVLEKTNKTKLTYIGHSMGTTLNYIMLASKPEYNDKINLAVSLTPAAFFVKPLSMVFRTILFFRPLLRIANFLKIYEVLPQSNLVIFFAKYVCSTFIGKFLCASILSPIFNLKNLNYSDLPSIYSIFPAGASLNTVIHYSQMAYTEELRKFDFGLDLNLQKYNSIKPPEYNWTKITVPLAMYYSNKDVFIRFQEASKLKHRVKNVVAFEELPDYNHFDFVFAKNTKKFYEKLLNLIKRFT